MMRVEKNLNALQVIVICFVLLGAFGFQFILREAPCPLCLLQRLGMLGVIAGGLMNIRFGIRKAHYGLSLLSCFFGGFVALRQISLHACPGTPTFGIPFFGISLYTWSFFVFSASVLYISLLLLIFDRPVEDAVPKPITPWGHFALILSVLIAALNIFSAFDLCGWGPCQ